MISIPWLIGSILHIRSGGVPPEMTPNSLMSIIEQQYAKVKENVVPFFTCLEMIFSRCTMDLII
jgi:hypothetical protein